MDRRHHRAGVGGGRHPAGARRKRRRHIDPLGCTACREADRRRCRRRGYAGRSAPSAEARQRQHRSVVGGRGRAQGTEATRGTRRRDLGARRFVARVEEPRGGDRGIIVAHRIPGGGQEYRGAGSRIVRPGRLPARPERARRPDRYGLDPGGEPIHWRGDRACRHRRRAVDAERKPARGEGAGGLGSGAVLPRRRPPGTQESGRERQRILDCFGRPRGREASRWRDRGPLHPERGIARCEGPRGRGRGGIVRRGPARGAEGARGKSRRGVHADREARRRDHRWPDDGDLHRDKTEDHRLGIEAIHHGQRAEGSYHCIGDHVR
ncbi:MAG: hypothetical protein WC483_06085 [Candidatus Paceibacterota bacterium]